MAVETGWHQRERGATERIGLAYPYGRELVHAPIPGNNTELAYDPASGIYLPRTISGPRSLSSYSPDVTKRWLNSAGGSYSIFANRRVFTAGTGTRSFFVSKAAYSSSGIYHYVTSVGRYQFEHWNGTVSIVDSGLGANDNDEFLITYNGTTLSFVLWSGGGTRYTYSAAINSYGASGAYTRINSADGGQSIGSDYFFVWNRVVTESEIEPLRNNPKAAYRFSPKTVFKFPSAGGGATTLTVQGLTQGHSLGSPSLTEHNILAVQGLGQAHTLGAPTLTQHNVLAANALSHAQSLGAPALTQHNVLAVNAIAQAHALGNVTLTQAHILTVQGIGQAHSLGAPSLTQHNALTPAPLTQAQTLGNISLTVAGSIAAADIAQGHSLGTPALTQHHVLTVAALMQAHSLDQPALSQAGTLAVQSMTQAQVLDAVALVQHHALAVQALLQGHALGSITLTASDALAIDGLTHAQILGAPSLTQHNVLAVQNMTHAQILQAVTLGGLVIGSLRGTLVAYSLLDGEVVCRALLSGSLETVH